MCEICDLNPPNTTLEREKTWADVHDRLASLTLAHRTSALVDDGGGVSLLEELHRLAQLVSAELPANKRSLVLALAIDLLARVQQHMPDLYGRLPIIQTGPYIRLTDHDDADPTVHDVMNSARMIRAAVEGGAPRSAVTELAGSEVLDVLAYGVRRAFAHQPDAGITVTDIGLISGRMSTVLLTLLAERLTATDLYAK